MIWMLHVGWALALGPLLVTGLSMNDMRPSTPSPDWTTQNTAGLQCRDCSPNVRQTCSVIDGCNELSRINDIPSYPGYPRDLRVDPFMREYRTADGIFNEMGMNISFGLPQLFGDTPLKGFYIKIIMLKSPHANEQRCFMLKLDNFTLLLQDQNVRYFHDCSFPMPGQMEVEVSVMSLPFREMSTYNTVSTRVTLPDAEGHAADTWKPEVIAELGDNEPCVVGRFSLGPVSFNYDQYKVRLKTGLPNAYTVRSMYVNVTAPMREKEFGTVSFTNLTDGTYYIWVHPYRRGTAMGRSNSSNTVNISVPVLIQPSTEDTEETSKVVLFSSVACGIVFTAVIISAVICLKRKRCLRRKRSLHPSSGEFCGHNNTEPSPNNFGYSPIDWSPTFCNPGVLNDSLPIVVPAGAHQCQETKKPRKVCVLFSDDSQEHSDVVHDFCTYLKTQCGCQVSLLPCTSEEEQPLSVMFLALQECDWVVIINSEGAYSKDHWYRQESPVLKTPPRMDLFASCIDYIRTHYIFHPNMRPYNKYLMVYFSYTPCAYLLPDLKEQLPCFELMGGINDFVLTLLGKEDFGPGEQNQGYKNNELDYLGSEEGSGLAVKIKRAQHQDSSDSGFGTFPADGEQQSASPSDTLSLSSVTSYELDKMLAVDNHLFESLDC